MTFLEKTAWALLLLVLWFVLCASIMRVADLDPVAAARQGATDEACLAGEGP